MKKILLVTLQGDNIGNRLQNYALQTILQSLNFEVYTPDYGLIEFPNWKFKIKFYIKSILGQLGLCQYKKYYYRRKRINKYQKFNKTYISNMFKSSFSKICDDIGKYDYAITGSDQVWHKWGGNKYELSYFYLEFMPKDKRISYAASFGFDKFPNEDLMAHKEGLNGINRLSCRESNGIKLIKDLTGREGTLVLDPTLLLNKEDWTVIEKKPDWISEKNYILDYFLGCKDKYIDNINKFAKENNLIVVEAYDPNSLNSQLTTPDEFIWLVHHAAYVCTDSFHATVFSLIFGKKFFSFRRSEPGMEKMFDRVENVQELFGVNRVFEGDINRISEDYMVNDVSNMKEFSVNYLKESLGILNE